MTKTIWKPKKLKGINPKKVVTEVYHRGVFVGGEQERPRPMTLPPPGWQPWRGRPDGIYDHLDQV